MPTSSWLIGSIVNFGDQTTDTWTIPQDDLVFLASPIIASSYPGSGTEVTNIAPSSGQVGTISGDSAYSSGYFEHSTGNGVAFDPFTAANDVFSGGATLLAWVRPDSDGEGSQGTAIEKGLIGSEGWRFYTGFDNGTMVTPTFRAYCDTSSGIWYKGLSLTLGDWALVTIYWDSDDPTTKPLMRINGVDQGVLTQQIAPVGTYVSDASHDLVMGSDSGGSWAFDGGTGLMAIYSRALTDDEHTSFYNVTKGMHGFTSSFVSTALTFSYDGTYLQHASAPLSMLTTFENALSAAGVDGADVFLGEDGYVHMTGTGVFGVSWSTAGTALRDALGFTGDLAAAASHIAPNLSPLLWVPRRDESPSLAPLGVVGDSTHAVGQVVAPDGTQATREFGSPIRRNRYTWNYIDKDQFWTSSEADGELFAFVRDVCVPGAKFWLYRQTEADYAVTTEVTLGDALGPYEHTGGLRALSLIRAAGFENTDCKFDWTAEVLKTPEYVT